MEAFDVWDVIKVPFPYTSRPVQQRRPALVVGQHEEPGSPHLLWVLMITSASHRRWLGDVEVIDLDMAGLPSPSVIRTAKIATIESADAGRIGKLSGSACSDVRSLVWLALKNLLGEQEGGSRAGTKPAV